MGAIKTGVKIGLGLLLFKIGCGLVTCGTLAGIPLAWFVCNSQKQATANLIEIKKTSSPIIINSISIFYPKGCNARTKPSISSDFAGWIPPNKRVTVLKNKGRWTLIKWYERQVWCGCKYRK